MKNSLLYKFCKLPVLLFFVVMGIQYSTFAKGGYFETQLNDACVECVIPSSSNVGVLKKNIRGFCIERKKKNQLSILRLQKLEKAKQPKGLGYDVPFNFKKYNNPLWKIGGLLFVSGYYLIAIGVLFLLQYLYFISLLWLYLLIIGLALMLASLPFLLVGKILGQTKSERSNPEDDMYN